MSRPWRLGPDDRRRVLWFFAYFFLTVSTTVVGKTARNTLFLSRFEPARLPWAFLAIAVVIAVAMPLYGRLARRMPARRLTLLTGTVFGVSLLGFAFATPGPAYALLYVWIELGTTLLFFQYWVLAGRAFTGREGKRLFGVIGTGAGIANIVAGLGLRQAVAALGTGVLVPATAATALASVAVAAGVPLRPAEGGERRPDRKETARRSRRADPELRRYLRWLALAGAASTVVFVVADYQFKYVTAAHATDADLAELFALVYAATGAGALLTQLLLTGPLLTRFGVRAGLTILPVSQLLAAGWLGWRPDLAAAIFLRGTDRSFRFTVDQATRQILWMPVSERERIRSKPFVDESVRQLAQAGAGASILLLGSWASARVLTVVTLPTILFWMLTNRRLSRLYVQRLRAAIDGSQALESPVEIDGSDPAVRALLRRVLDAGSERERVYAIGLVRDLGIEGLGESLAELWRSGPVAVRLAVLDLASDDPDMLPATVLLAAAREEPDERVSVAAISALSQHGALDGVAQAALEALLADRRASVRDAAAAALLRHARDHEGARRVLEAALDGALAGDAVDGGRAVAALAAAGAIDGPRAHQIMERGTVETRAAALSELAACGLDDAELLADALAALDHPGTTASALRYLEARREAGIAALAARLRDDTRPWPAGARALAVLLARGPEHARTAVVLPIDSLVARALRSLEPWPAVASLPSSAWIREELRQRLRRHLVELCAIAACRAPEVDVERHVEALGAGPAERSSALEHLDSVLSNPDRATLVPLLERLSHAVGGDERASSSATSPAAESAFAALLGGLDGSRDPGRRLIAAQYRWLNRDGPGREEPGMISRLEKALFVQKVDLFRDLTGLEAAAVADLLVEVSVDPGTALFAQDDEGDSLYIVRSGRIAIRRDERQVATLAAGECFGELAVLDGRPRTATAIALEDSALLELHRDDLLGLLAARPHALRSVLELLTGRVREIAAREPSGSAS